MDKAYHRLLTSDNVSKFRPEIIERLESKSRSRSYVEKAGRELAGIRELSGDEAEELVYHYIHQVIDAFQNMDEILSEINRKNTQYQRAAINRDHMDLGGIYRIGFMDDLIRIYSSAVLDEKSLYTPIEGKKAFEPEMLSDEEPNRELREEKMRRILEKLARVLNPEKVNHYVEKQLGDRREMSASELPLENTDDFVKMIYIRLYGQRKNMRYTIAVKEPIKKNGYRFTDFVIHRKEHG